MNKENENKENKSGCGIIMAILFILVIFTIYVFIQLFDVGIEPFLREPTMIIPVLVACAILFITWIVISIKK